MRIGVLVAGDVAVRAAHSLSAHESVDEVVVIGPATSRTFTVVDSADGCDFVVGTGNQALTKAKRFDVPLIWDGEEPLSGVAVYGANPRGLTLAIASRESEPRLVAVAHPDLAGGSDSQTRFPDPVGMLETRDGSYGGQLLAQATSPNEFAACLVIGGHRRVTMVDDASFMSGIALAAAVDTVGGQPKPVWEEALGYLHSATAMGLVMAEDS